MSKNMRFPHRERAALARSRQQSVARGKVRGRVYLADEDPDVFQEQARDLIAAQWGLRDLEQAARNEEALHAFRSRVPFVEAFQL
ncbi:hypothetical protein GTQ45_01915 [Pyruvatibacter mobilis]|uniref:Uncharacterized protein n=1 Tax=Pyruvatibacter mobilis TaxID=1712261 RepID=A0A845Q7T8_9HYPH|nr:hypothetical protein [Pyruvatibacter mobilis]NBG94487.1 hypothetical protein [Pyruvatibacter mobilis]QJD74007.1 hypothetical protein HG718_00465 [Pyruvatibacter mobilis]GGD03318.1 hypothetical protein GCM10011587_03820 [Pyruvatibacter mobilis]